MTALRKPSGWLDGRGSLSFRSGAPGSGGSETMLERSLTSLLNGVFGRRDRPLVLTPYTAPRHGMIVKAIMLVGLAMFCFVFGFFYALTTPFLLKQLTVPIAILAAVVVWALPDLKASPHGALNGLSFTFLLTLLLWPNYLAIALPGLPWITFIRLVAFPMIFVLLVSLSVSKEFRSKLSEILSAAPVVWKLLVSFSVIQLLCIAFTNNLDHSIQRTINHHVTCTAIFFASCYAFSYPGRVQRWAVFLWCVAIILCVIGVVELSMTRPPWGAHVPSFLKIEDEGVIRVLTGAVRSATGQYRVQSTFTTSLTLAEFLALTVPFVVHFGVRSKLTYVKIAAAASLPLMFYVVIITDSRLGMVGFLLALMLYLLMWSVLRWKEVKASLIAPAIVLAYPAIFVVFIFATFAIGRLRNMVWGGGDTAASNASRTAQYEGGIPMILKQPWGHGPGMGGETLGFVSPSGVVTIDTYYLAVGLEYGIAGFVAFYGMIIASIYYTGKLAIKNPQGEFSFLVPLSIAFTNFFVIKSVFSQQDNHPLVFMMMGIATALAYRQATETGGVGATAEIGQRLQSLSQRGGPRSPRSPAAQPERA